MPMTIRQGSFTWEYGEVTIIGTYHAIGKILMFGINSCIDNEYFGTCGILFGDNIVQRQRALIDAIQSPRRCNHEWCGIEDIIRLYYQVGDGYLLVLYNNIHDGVTVQSSKCRLRLYPSS